LDDAKVISAKTWNTIVTPAQFTRSTKVEEIPDYLKPNLNADGNLEVASNGEFVFKLHGIHAKISVIWDYEAPAGGGDTHYSLMRGTKVSAIIRQGKEQGYKPMLYLEPREGVDRSSLEESLAAAVKKAVATWPGVEVAKTDAGWVVNFPDSYRLGHEAHFSQVATDFLGYLKKGEMPAWEVPNTLAKYRTIMDAYRMSR
jgi:hypothetical protein